jgi:hypothetical protein
MGRGEEGGTHIDPKVAWNFKAVMAAQAAIHASLGR